MDFDPEIYDDSEFFQVKLYNKYKNYNNIKELVKEYTTENQLLEDENEYFNED